MPAVSSKAKADDFGGQKKSLIPRLTFKKIAKIQRPSNAKVVSSQKLHDCKKLKRLSIKSKKHENKENETATTSSTFNKTRNFRNEFKNNQNSVVKKPNLIQKKVENLNPSFKKSFVNKQIENGLVSFEPDPKALQSILVNKGITSNLFSGRFSNARPSLYGNLSRLSTKTLSIKEVTLSFAEAIARQASSSTNDDAQNIVTAQAKTPVRLSMYGRRTSIVKFNKTPSSLLLTRTVVPNNPSSTVQKCASSTIKPDASHSTAGKPVTFPSTISKPFLLSIDEGDLERDFLSPKPTEVEIRRDSGAFNTYHKSGEESIAQKSDHFIHTPKPKRRFEDERKSFADILNVSPLCDNSLIQIKPPIRTPLLMRTVSMRVKHEQNTNAKSPFSLRKSSPKFDSVTDDESPNAISDSISPILKCTKDDTKSDYHRFGVVADDVLDRLCDAEVENLTKNAAKRLKMMTTDAFVLRFNEPVAATLTNGDDQCFLPIIEE